MIFIIDELDRFEKNIIELAENVGFKECKTIEAIDLFCGISEKNDVLKEKDTKNFDQTFFERQNHTFLISQLYFSDLPNKAWS